MDRNIDQINCEYQRLEDAGLLSEKAKQKEKGNYKIRYGITKKPCFKRIDCTKMLPPLHYWICALNHMENFAYHINTPQRLFKNKKRVMRKNQRKGKDAKDAIKKAKNVFIFEGRTKLGILFDSPNSGGTGGSTDGANNSRDFFSENNRDKVLELFKVNKPDKAKIRRILRDINVIARVANSTRKIDVAKFKIFCKDAYIFKIKAFKFASCPVTLHRGYSHLADIIFLNDSMGLGTVSESCLGRIK